MLSGTKCNKIFNLDKSHQPSSRFHKMTPQTMNKRHSILEVTNNYMLYHTMTFVNHLWKVPHETSREVATIFSLYFLSSFLCIRHFFFFFTLFLLVTCYMCGVTWIFQVAVVSYFYVLHLLY